MLECKNTTRQGRCSTNHRRTALLCKELEHFKVDIAAICETRFEGSDQLVEQGYTLFWKGKTKEEKRESGVGFVLKNTIVEKLEELPLGISDRIMVLRVPLSKGRYASFVSVYAPTMTSCDEEIGRFYESLRGTLRSIKKEDKLLLVGDFNARVGKDHNIWKCLGKHGFGSCNSNGLLLLQLCTEFDLTVGNTVFRQKNKYKGTWMHPRSKRWHMIDYIIGRRERYPRFSLCDCQKNGRFQY